MPHPGAAPVAVEAVTFLFTDIEGSTRLAHELGDAWFDVLEEHHALMRTVIAEHAGQEVSTAGDSFFVAFGRAEQAIAAAVAVQRSLAAHDWTPNPPVRVRIGMHTGDAVLRDGDFAGLSVHAASRVESAAAGGQIIVTEATLEAARPLPSGVDVIDLGAHRLKDLPADLRLFQIAADGLERNFPPVRGIAALRNNVPTPVASFVGRREALTSLGRLVDADRLVTLVGPGGTGKTRLALQLAAERLHRHSGGVWFIELDAARGEPTVAGAVAHAMGVQEERGRPVLETVTEALRASDALLVLDNCEHVIDAVARVAEHLLRSAPLVRVVATSREPLLIAGERVFPVEPLSVHGAAGETSEAVQLLADRVERVRPDFSLSADRAAATAVAERLDGLPLALELAAASAAMMTLGEIADSLDRRFDVLTRGSRTALDRQKTLWGAIDWSFDLLGEGERRAFRRLAVFLGDFDRDAVGGICGDPGTEAATHLDALTRKSLVVATPAGRFRLLESIRAYARERLAEAGEEPRFAEAHARWFGDLIAGPRHGTGNSSLDLVHDDAAGALHWAADHDAPLALRMLGPLQGFWRARGRWTEGRARTEHVLTATASLATEERVTALVLDAELAFLVGDTAVFRSRIEEAVTLADSIGNPERAHAILGNLGALAAREGDLDAAEALYERALANARHHAIETAIFELQLAEIARRRGDPELARDRGERALARARELRHDDLAARVVALLGGVAHERGDLDAARAHYGEALDAARTVGDEGQVAYLLFCLATLALDGGAAHDAVAPLCEALELGEAIGSNDDLVESLEAAARLAALGGDASLAARLLGAVDATREAIGFPRAPSEQPAYAALIDEVRSALGGTEFDALVAGGAQGGLDAAVQTALAAIARA